MNLLLSEDPYKTLGIGRAASEDEIKQAYFKKVREFSPELDPEGFKRVRAAYDKLRSRKERAATDLFMVENLDPEIGASAIMRSETMISPLTPELLRRDLIALETFLLLEELRNQPL